MKSVADRPRDHRNAVNRALRAATNHAKLSTRRNTPWELLHAALGLGVEAELLDEEGRRTITLLEYFRRGGPYFSEPIYVIRGDDVEMRKSKHPSEIERHPNQFLAYFAQMRLPAETRFRVQDRSFTIADMVATARKKFNPDAEATFTLIALSVYDAPDRAWKNEFGQVFSLSDLVALELRAERTGLACGGAHTNFALGLALKDHRPSSGGLKGPWKAAADRLREEVHAVRQSQGEDGSLPFKNRSYDPESNVVGVLESKIYSTGHTLEWLILTLPDDDLGAAWVHQAVEFLADAVLRCSSEPPAASPWYHAIHALRMYQQATETAHPHSRASTRLSATRKPFASRLGRTDDAARSMPSLAQHFDFPTSSRRSDETW